MHMISKKDLSEAEMDTLTKSCSPYDSHNRQWRSANARRGNCVCQRIGYILDNECPRETIQQCYRSESFAMKTGIPMNGSMVKNHISLRTEFGSFATRKTSFPIVVPGLSSSSSGSSSTSRDTYETGESFFIIFFDLAFFTVQ